MKIVGNIYASDLLGIRIRKSITDYIHSHGDGDIRASTVIIRICSCHDWIVHPWINLTTPIGIELSATILQDYIRTDERVGLASDSELAVSITQGDVA